MKIRTHKFVALFAGFATILGSFSFASAANADTPVELVFGPQVGIAEDGSFYVIPGEFSGDVTDITTTWFSCPTMQLGAIGDAAELTQQVADAGCVEVSTDKSLLADAFDYETTFPLLLQVANGTVAAYQGTTIVMYDKGVGPIAYNQRGASTVLSRTLHFAGNSATLNASARAGLFGLVSKLGKASHVVLTIDAYATKGGKAAKNIALARGRARQVMFFFKRKGINATVKIRTHVASVATAAGRKAIVKVSFVPGRVIL